MIIYGVSSNTSIGDLFLAGFMLIVGMFLDSGPAIILLVPVLVPLAQSLDVNLTQFGLMMVINLTIGLLTPPVGTALYVACNISNLPLAQLSRAVLPFIGVMLLVLAMITYIPEMTLMVIKHAP